ncbi:MAG TPA: hypothetical protein VF103_07220 [Polyangiaceae bacterium]
MSLPNTTKSIHLERETFDRAVEVSDGFWMIATRHRPGFMKMQPEVNNRCLIFRVRDQKRNEDVLVVSNGVDPKVIPEVRRIERETGLSVRTILSPGGGHHLLMPAWRDEFTRAEILVCPVRVPNIASAEPLMRGGRVRAMDLVNPLPEFAGELEAVVFHGLYGFADMKTPFEGKKEGFFTMFSMMKEMMSLKTPDDELWLHHVPTGTVIGGENLGWILSEKTVKSFPLMMRPMMKVNTVYVQDKARKVSDPRVVRDCWKRILDWPGRTLIGYHEPPGEGFLGDTRAELGRAVRQVGQLSD